MFSPTERSIFPEVASHEVDHLSLDGRRFALRFESISPLRALRRSDFEEDSPPEELSHEEEVLGPPLEFLPKDLEI